MAPVFLEMGEKSLHAMRKPYVCPLRRIRENFKLFRISKPQAVRYRFEYGFCAMGDYFHFAGDYYYRKLSKKDGESRSPSANRSGRYS